MNAKEFIRALDHITAEKNISKDVVFEAMELALATAYKKNFNSKTNVKVKINRDTGDIRVYSYYVVVDDYDDGTETTDEEGNIVWAGAPLSQYLGNVVRKRIRKRYVVIEKELFGKKRTVLLSIRLKGEE